VDDEWHAVHYRVFDLPGHGGAFAARAAAIEAIARRAAWPQLVAVAQVALADRAALARRLADVVQGGGEGLVLHRADALWHAGRSDALLKLKPLDDAEATVLGAIKGHGKYATVMGALRVRSDDGREFLLGSGFSDAQRAQPPAVGSVVTYTYRGHTAGGLPRFASFLREREIEF
jgi:DNA ligase-1